MITRVNIDTTKLNTQERMDKIKEVSMEVHRVLNSTVFRDEVLKIRKDGELSRYKDSTNMKIYKMLMDGAEVLDPKIDNEWDILIDDYYSIKRVIGHTYPNTKTLFVNTRYFDSSKNISIGSNLVHEYGHKLGFDHDFRRTKRRPYSICYQLNKAYENAYNKVINGSPQVDIDTGSVTLKLDKVRVCTRSWKTLWLVRKCYWTYK